MAKAEASVDELVGMIERGELRLPEMQRHYVWRSTRVRDLMDSLYRGYPSGAILLWETDENVPLRDFSVAQVGNPYQSVRLLLDGQQRLTSLSAVVRGQPVSVRGRKRPIDLLFNLEHPEGLPFVTEVDENGDDDEGDDGASVTEDDADSNEDELQERFNKMTFVVSTRKLAQMPTWVRVSDVFKSDSDAQFLKAAGVSGFDDPRYEKYSQRLARLRGIKKYVYRMDVLERSLSYDEVTEIFVRVNSLGAKLRSSDLALAQITAKWRHSLQIFLTFQEECAKLGFDLDLGIHLKNLVVFATNQSRFLTVGRINLEKLQLAWKEGCDGMRFAINFLKSNAGIESPVLLSSPFILITLAYFGRTLDYQLSGADERDLRRWVLTANAKGRYSRGSSETILDQDLAAIRNGGRGLELIERLKLQVGRLEIAAEDLEGRNQRSALFKTMFLAFRQNGAKDWRSNLAIALDHSGSQHQLQFHHIFPKKQLRASCTSREAEDIGNLAFIGGKTNRAISDKPPAQYLLSLIEQHGPAPFHAQAIPTDRHLLEIDAYKDFLGVRRQEIAKQLNAFLSSVGMTKAETGAVSIEAIIANGESDEIEFKSSLRWDYRQGAANKALEAVIVKSVAAFANSNGGTLLIGVDDAGTVLGLDRDYAALGGVDRDKFELHLRNLLVNAYGPAFTASKIKLSFPAAAGVEICQMTIAPAAKPLVTKVADKNGQPGEKFYVRNGNSSREMPMSEMQEYIAQRFV